MGAAAELGRHLTFNIPALKPPTPLTATALAIVTASFTAVLFWIYASIYWLIKNFRVAPYLPVAAATAAFFAPQVWFGAYHLLPHAKLSWLAALTFGFIVTPVFAWAFAAGLRRRGFLKAVTLITIICLTVMAGRRLLNSGREPAERRPNVVLVTLDTVRADHLGCYGYEAAQTPVLDGLARRGVSFRRAICQEPLTAPSHAAIMTSLYPRTTGVVLNAMKLRPDVPTLAETLKGAGYRTAAFVAATAVNARSTALNRGFEIYDDAVTPAEMYRSTPLVPRALAVKFSIVKLDDNAAERPADQVTAAAALWLKRRARQPFFLWLHYYDAHDDYLPPPTFVRPALGGRPYYRLLNKRWGNDDADDRLRGFILELYDGEIAFIDQQLGVFLNLLQARGVAEKTIIVIVGDHGEAFGEHGTKFHGFRLYDEEIRVPFIIADLGGPLPPAIPSTTVVTTLDVAPTILNMVGIARPRGMLGRSVFDGQLNDGGRAAYSIVVPEPLRAHRYDAGPLETVTTANEKLIVTATGLVEYYDLTEDPGEKTNLADQSPDRVRELLAVLEAARAAAPPAPLSRRVMDGSTLKKLRALGYVK